MLAENAHEHCGQDMKVSKAVLTFSACGYEEARPKGEDFSQTRPWPEHCRHPMDLERTCECVVCGHTETEKVKA